MSSCSVAHQPDLVNTVVECLEALAETGVSSTARLVAVLEAIGITDRSTIERLTASAQSTVRRAVSSLRNERSESSGAQNRALKNERIAQNRALERSKSSVGTDHAIAHANKESPSEIDSLKRESPPFFPPNEFGSRVRMEKGSIVVSDEYRKDWLQDFPDARELDLALRQAAAWVQPNSFRPLEVQVSAQLARYARERRERDGRYQAAKPRPRLTREELIAAGDRAAQRIEEQEAARHAARR